MPSSRVRYAWSLHQTSDAVFGSNRNAVLVEDNQQLMQLLRYNADKFLRNSFNWIKTRILIIFSIKSVITIKQPT